MTKPTDSPPRDAEDPRRDVELGAALRALDTPDHDTGFFSDLERSMSAVDRRRATRSRRQPWWHRWFGGWRVLTVPAAVAAVLAVLWVWGGPGSSNRLLDDLTVSPASAAEITAKMRAALSAATSLAGDLVVLAPDGAGEATGEMRWRFVATARGDFKLTGTNTLADGTIRTEEIAYDAGTGIDRSYSQEGDGQPVYGGERSGLAAGPPDQGPSDWILQRRLGSVVRALLAAEDPAVTETTFDGREAWVLDTPVRRNLIAGLSGDRLEVTVDQQTGFPVRVVETQGGALVEEVRLENLEIDGPTPTFTLEFPEDAEISVTDVGFARLDPADLETAVRELVGYQPLMPSWIPDGYAIAEVAVAESALPTGVEGMNPQSEGVVSVAFRRGFDRFVLSTRRVGDDATLWADPLASGEGFKDEPERVTLAAGPFAPEGADAVAEILLDARATPHLWARNDTLVLTLSGDLSREELIRVAESLVTAIGPMTPATD